MLSDYFNEFRTAVQCGDVAQAATKLGLSRKTLQRHFAAIEERLGIKLFEPGARMRLTEDGRYVYYIASEMAALGSSLERQLTERGTDRPRRQVMIGGLTNPHVVRRAFEVGCNRLRASYYDLVVGYMRPDAFASMGRSLAKGDVDVVLALGSSCARAAADGTAGADGLAFSKLCDVGVVAVVERPHDIADRTSVTLSDILGYTFSRVVGLYDNMGAIWDEFNRVCEDRGFAPSVRTIGFECVPGFDVRYPGYVWVFDAENNQVEFLTSQGCSAVPIADVSFELYAVTRADDAAARRLVREACSVLQGEEGAPAGGGARPGA